MRGTLILALALLAVALSVIPANALSVRVPVQIGVHVTAPGYVYEMEAVKAGNVTYILYGTTPDLKTGEFTVLAFYDNGTYKRIATIEVPVATLVKAFAAQDRVVAVFTSTTQSGYRTYVAILDSNGSTSELLNITGYAYTASLSGGTTPTATTWASQAPYSTPQWRYSPTPSSPAGSQSH